MPVVQQLLEDYWASLSCWSRRVFEYMVCSFTSAAVFGGHLLNKTKNLFLLQLYFGTWFRNLAPVRASVVLKSVCLFVVANSHKMNASISLWELMIFQVLPRLTTHHAPFFVAGGSERPQ